jgi:hypothetical protein
MSPVADVEQLQLLLEHHQVRDLSLLWVALRDALCSTLVTRAHFDSFSLCARAARHDSCLSVMLQLQSCAMQIERIKKEADEAEAKGDALGFTRTVSSSRGRTGSQCSSGSSSRTQTGS